MGAGEAQSAKFKAQEAIAKPWNPPKETEENERKQLPNFDFFRLFSFFSAGSEIASQSSKFKRNSKGRVPKRGGTIRLI